MHALTLAETEAINGGTQPPPRIGATPGPDTSTTWGNYAGYPYYPAYPSNPWVYPYA